jgi:hypothetical protein
MEQSCLSGTKLSCTIFCLNLPQILVNVLMHRLECVIIIITLLGQVAKNCDEVFAKKPFSARNFNDSAVFVAKPSVEIWRKMMDAVQTKKFGNGVHLKMSLILIM